MATAREQQMKMQEKLAAIRKEIEALRIQEKLLVELLGDDAPKKEKKVRQRSPSVKPIVLEYMADRGTAGATSKEVDEFIKERVPTVAQDTVGSVLSRLKSDGALSYDGERYYEKRFAPARPFDANLRAVG